MIVRGYGRCSTERQALSPLQQESVVTDAFNLFKQVKSGWKDAIWGGFFCEEPITRTSMFRERPVGSLLLASTKPGDVILVSNFDRIFANVIDVCETIELIEQRQFQITILDTDVDISTNMGQACFKMAAIFKELEVKEIRRRSRDTAKYRKGAGLPAPGRPAVGWRVMRVLVRGVNRGFLVPDHDQREFVEELVKLRHATGGSIRSFVKLLNKEKIRQRKWTRPAVTRMLKAHAQGFPLHNGTHDPEPIPPDAMPIPTIGSPN